MSKPLSTRPSNEKITDVPAETIQELARPWRKRPGGFHRVGLALGHRRRVRTRPFARDGACHHGHQLALAGWGAKGGVDHVPPRFRRRRFLLVEDARLAARPRSLLPSGIGDAEYPFNSGCRQFNGCVAGDARG